MKNVLLLPVYLLLVFFTSCSSTKKISGEGLYNVTWELEYLSGPRIAFEGLFPDQKPYITFNQATKKAEGNNSCNGYSAGYTLDGTNISFGEPGPTTMMFCGEGEKFFLDIIKKVNKYNIDAEGKLNLLIDDVPMMRFKKLIAR